MSEAPVFQSFPIMSGEDVQLEFTVTDNDGLVVNLTGGNGRFAAARNPNSATLVIDSDASPATATVAVQNAPNGLVNVSIADTVTDALHGDYYWEFKWTDVTANECVVARGWLTIQTNLI